ncbi:hypothetical protein [Aquabacter spiritensis]|uniref:Uncharacterized protein n=1 Tax=Aquabacter spiritensis TaxID=933073 RepID=A0A4R3M1Q2_9HYPH|nr:hypothetical protein [Aquabacter spiritensis]TCT06653.1 hypothetical protein EDC64_102132 [Aquabacter spiritensis]
MSPAEQRPKPLSTSERRRQIEESVAVAMDRYKSEGDLMRTKTERLKALREAHQSAMSAEAAEGKTAKAPAKTSARANEKAGVTPPKAVRKTTSAAAKPAADPARKRQPAKV